MRSQLTRDRAERECVVLSARAYLEAGRAVAAHFLGLDLPRVSLETHQAYRLPRWFRPLVGSPDWPPDRIVDLGARLITAASFATNVTYRFCPDERVHVPGTTSYGDHSAVPANLCTDAVPAWDRMLETAYALDPDRRTYRTWACATWPVARALQKRGSLTRSTVAKHIRAALRQPDPLVSRYLQWVDRRPPLQTMQGRWGSSYITERVRRKFLT